MNAFAQKLRLGLRWCRKGLRLVCCKSHPQTVFNLQVFLFYGRELSRCLYGGNLLFCEGPSRQKRSGPKSRPLCHIVLRSVCMSFAKVCVHNCHNVVSFCRLSPKRARLELTIGQAKAMHLRDIFGAGGQQDRSLSGKRTSCQCGQSTIMMWFAMFQ